MSKYTYRFNPFFRYRANLDRVAKAAYLTSGVTRKERRVAVTAGAQTITFADGNMPDATYALQIECYDAAGNAIRYTRGAQTQSGFDITPVAPGFIDIDVTDD